MFSLSPRHQGLIGLNDYANNTSSTDNSNFTSSSTSSHEIAMHHASASHEDATPTEIGAISAALPVMMCGLSYNHILGHAQANELKNSVDDGAEQQRVAFVNFGTDNKALQFFSRLLHLDVVTILALAAKFAVLCGLDWPVCAWQLQIQIEDVIYFILMDLFPFHPHFDDNHIKKAFTATAELTGLDCWASGMRSIFILWPRNDGNCFQNFVSKQTHSIRDHKFST